MIAYKKSSNSLILMLILLLAFMVAGFFQGPVNIPLDKALNILASQLGWGASHEDTRPWMQSVLMDVRMPRILVGTLAGACLAICGTVMQGMFRNPLASPSILGVSSGASLGAVVALYLGLASISIWALPVFASAGACLTLLLVYRVASQRGHMAMGTLLLSWTSSSNTLQSYYIQGCLKDDVQESIELSDPYADPATGVYGGRFFPGTCEYPIR